MDENKEVVITYETIFELLRREKDREALQKLHDSFLDDVASYIGDKTKKLKEQEGSSSIAEKMKVEKQIQNIRRILIDLYSRRERKVVNLALDKIKTNEELDTSSLLKEEKQLFDFMVSILGNGREKILNNLLEGKIPEKIEQKMEKPKIINESKQEVDSETKLLRFLHAVPRFLGKELEEYGPFEEEDVASLPKEIAGVLVNKGRAEEINSY